MEKSVPEKQQKQGEHVLILIRDCLSKIARGIKIAAKRQPH